ncbi:MAG: hypothetical protein ABL907_10735 [Hyphomicrobium sp.]
MKHLIRMAAGAAALLAVAGSAEAKCVMAGGEATMVTEDLAKFMAEAALKNSIAAHNWKASGPVKMKCDAPNGLPHCKANRKACS